MKIETEKLEKLNEEYLNDRVNSIVRSALNKTSISDLSIIQERGEFVKNRFSIDIDTLPATNQKSSGRCWIFAGCNILREEIAQKYNLDNFEVSQNYVAFYDKLEKCNYFMKKVIELRHANKDDRTYSHILEKGIEDGGQWDMFVSIINKYGIVPKDSFEETYQSSNTKEVINLLNKYLRKFAFDIRKMEEDEIKKLYENAIKDIYTILCNCFGIPPKTFTFEYVDKVKNYNIIKDITPLEFLNSYINIDLNDYISIINSPTQDKPFNKTYTVKHLGNVVEGKPVMYLNLEMNEFKKLVIEQLKNKELVWFGSDCGKCSIKTDGVWDDLSFREQELFGVDLNISKEAMLDMRHSAMNHAMVITGVNLDDDIPTKWKIENSWGDKEANKGYYVASDSWFDKYVYQAVINKKYLTAKQIELLETKPIEIEPWDPMGTLA